MSGEKCVSMANTVRALVAFCRKQRRKVLRLTHGDYNFAQAICDRHAGSDPALACE